MNPVFWGFDIVSQKKIGLSEACIGDAEKQKVLAVLESGWLTQGNYVATFEKTFAKSHGMPHAVAVNSATAGLHLALAALGVGPGDEVLTPSITFVATANAVFYAGALPRPVDAQPNCPHMDINHAETLIGPRTRAVILMHYGGYRMDIGAWANFAHAHKLLLLEDAAHCPGLAGVGQKSDAAVYSFFGNKNMTTAEGGMITTRDQSLTERMCRLRGHAMSTPTLSRAKGHAFSYDIKELGWNYRMDEVRAAIGLAQLEELTNRNAIRAELARYYYLILRQTLPNIHTPFTEDHPSAHHLFTVLLPEGIKRQSIMQAMSAEGIQTSIHYPLWHHFTWHQKQVGITDLPHAQAYNAATLTLPLHPGMVKDDVEYIVETLQHILAEV